MDTHATGMPARPTWKSHRETPPCHSLTDGYENFLQSLYLQQAATTTKELWKLAYENMGNQEIERGVELISGHSLKGMWFA